mmetsp:Transcript_16849/g.23776  ORF Transcript_16849/g.23776 Transcript_16849/m.23776 type:complete len:96 (+) Transcript_16849:359-646(+)
MVHHLSRVQKNSGETPSSIGMDYGGGIKRERMDEDGVEHSAKPPYIKMQCLRIGKYKHRGLTVKPARQINNSEFHSNSVTFNHNISLSTWYARCC